MRREGVRPIGLLKLGTRVQKKLRLGTMSAIMAEQHVTDLHNRGFFYNLGPTYRQQRCAGIDQLLRDAGAAKAARNVEGGGAVPAGNVMREQDKVETEEIRQ